MISHSSIDLANPPANDLALHRAVLARDYETAKSLLLAGAEQITDFVNGYPLHMAVSNGQGEMIILLLKHGGDLSKRHDDRTPMRLACYKRKFDIIQLIAENKRTNPFDRFECNTFDISGNDGSIDSYEYGYALCFTTEHKKHECMTALLKAYAPHSKYKYYNNSPLHLAVLNKDIESIILLLDHRGDLSKVNNNNKTPVRLALDLRYFDIIKRITDYVKYADADDFSYVLHQCVIDDEYECAKSLLIAGTRQKYDADKNCYPLHDLARRDNDKMLKLFLQFNPNIQVLDDTAKTPLQIACNLNKFNNIKIFADSFAQFFSDKNEVIVSQLYDEDIRLELEYALHQTVIKNNYKCAAHLLSIGIKQSKIALHQAVKNKNTKMIGLLMDNNGDLSAKEDNRTPIQLAYSLQYMCIIKFIADKQIMDKEDTYGYSSILYELVRQNKFIYVESLLKAGARQICDDATKEYPLHAAVKKNNLAIFVLLLQYGGDLACIDTETKSTPIDYAVQQSRYYFVGSAASMCKTDTKDSYHYSHAFIRAVMKKEYNCALSLLHAGAIIDKVDPTIHRFLQNHYSDIAIVLVQACNQNTSMFSIFMEDIVKKILDNLVKQFLIETVSNDLKTTRKQIYNIQVKCFVEGFNKLGFFSVTSKCRSFAKQLEITHKSYADINPCINDYLTSESQDMQTIQLLKRYRLASNSSCLFAEANIAIPLNTSNPYHYFHRAQGYMQNGKLKQAYSDYIMAAKLASPESDIFDHFQLFLLKLSEANLKDLGVSGIFQAISLLPHGHRMTMVEIICDTKQKEIALNKYFHGEEDSFLDSMVNLKKKMLGELELMRQEFYKQASYSL